MYIKNNEYAKKNTNQLLTGSVFNLVLPFNFKAKQNKAFGQFLIRTPQLKDSLSLNYEDRNSKKQ